MIQTREREDSPAFSVFAQKIRNFPQILPLPMEKDKKVLYNAHTEKIRQQEAYHA